MSSSYYGRRTTSYASQLILNIGHMFLSHSRYGSDFMLCLARVVQTRKKQLMSCNQQSHPSVFPLPILRSSPITCQNDSQEQTLLSTVCIPKFHQNIRKSCIQDVCVRGRPFISSVRSSYSHPDLLLIHPPPHHPLFQITSVLNTGLSLSEPLQLYKGHKAI